MVDEFINLITQVPAIGWATLALVLLGIELLAPSSWLLWPALSALIIAGIAFWVPQINLVEQILIFGLLAVALLIIGRRFLKMANKKVSVLNQRNNQLIGRRIMVVNDGPDGNSRAKVDDSEWAVRHRDQLPLHAGQSVEVVGTDGIRLLVIPVTEMNA